MKKLKTARAIARKLEEIEDDVKFLVQLFPESVELSLALSSLREARKCLMKVRVRESSIKLPGGDME